jgi:pimeloyl-ACP methyl ester carboxylesterase
MTTWVLLRGLTRETRHWGDLPERLAFRLGGAPVLAVDLPGNGSRHLERSPASVEDLLTATRAAAFAGDAAPPYVLVALSLGAMVAMAWASRHADELAGLVLINTSSGGSSPWHRRLRWQRAAQVLRIVAARSAVARERAVLRLTSRHAPLAEDVLVARWAAWRREHPVSIGNALRQLVAAARFRAASTPPPMPTLLLVSLGDALVDPACSVALARRWSVPLNVHPTAGHDLPLDDAGWVADAVAAWWRDGADARAPGAGVPAKAAPRRSSSEPQA